MPRIRLALGRRHQYRRLPVYKEKASGEVPDEPLIHVSQTSMRQMDNNAKAPRTLVVSHADCLVSLDSHPVLGKLAVARKDVMMSSVPKAGVPVIYVSQKAPRTLFASHAVVDVCGCVPSIVTALPISDCLVSLDSHPALGKLAVARKDVMMSSVSKAGLPMVCVSRTTSSTLADHTKNCVTAPVPQFIFGTLGGPCRSLSIHAGAHNTDCFYDDEVTEHNLTDCSDQPFKIEIGDSEQLCDVISAEKGDMELKILGFKKRYIEFVRPLLASRCLIAPEDLSHHSTVFLHRQTFHLANHNAKYLSCFDIMAHESGMTPDEWNMFLDHLVRNKVYVIEDWMLSMSTIQTLMYDHGIIAPQDDTDVDFCKGECDASYNPLSKSASLAFIIWRGDKIIYSEIYKNVGCESATQAELYAAFALLSKAKKLGIQKLLLCSDCVTVCNVLSGELCIENVEASSSAKGDQNVEASSSATDNQNVKATSSAKDNQNVKAASSANDDQNVKASSSAQDDKKKAYDKLVLYLMLRSMKRHFKNLISMWKPRELMVFADDLAKANELIVGEPYFPEQAMQKWSNHLKGLPLFRIEWTESTKKQIGNFGKVQLDESHGRNTESIFYIEVENQYKFDCLSGVIQAFGTVNLLLFVSDITGKSKTEPGFLEQLEKLEKIVDFHSENRSGICSCFTYLPDNNAAHKSLVIVFDATVPMDLYYKKTAFHVIFVTPKERNIIDVMKIPELTALSFVHFNGVTYPLNEDKGDQPQKKR